MAIMSLSLLMLLATASLAAPAPAPTTPAQLAKRQTKVDCKPGVTLCADYINSCSVWYGGCYDICSSTTFTDPGCPSSAPLPSFPGLTIPTPSAIQPEPTSISASASASSVNILPEPSTSASVTASPSEVTPSPIPEPSAMLSSVSSSAPSLSELTISTLSEISRPTPLTLSVSFYRKPHPEGYIGY